MATAFFWNVTQPFYAEDGGVSCSETSVSIKLSGVILRQDTAKRSTRHGHGH